MSTPFMKTLAVASLACFINMLNVNDAKAQSAVSNPTHPKMSARERLAKNNHLERNFDLAANDLKGKVKVESTKDYSVVMKDGKQEKFLIRVSKTMYNRAGQVVEMTGGTKEDRSEWRTQIMYDAHNNDTCIFNYLGSSANTKSVIRFDSRGNEIANINYDEAGKISSRSCYKYDDNDNLIEMDEYSASNKLTSKDTYTLDANGFDTGGTGYDSTGKPRASFICKHDENGNVLYGSVFKPDGSMMVTDSFTYNGKGQRITDFVYRGSISKGDQPSTFRTTYKYNDRGDVTEAIAHNGDGSIDDKKTEYYDYTYDAAGNVNSKTTYVVTDSEKSVSSIFEAVYVYY